MTDTGFLIRKFMRQLTLFSLLIIALAVLFRLFAPPEIISPALFYLIAFFYAITAALYILLLQGARKKQIKFNNRFMLSTVVKLLGFLIVMLAYVFVYPGDAVNFLVTFLVLYFLYTAFEVVKIVKVTKNLKPEEYYDNKKKIE
ncbi:MAG: hypothetical protein R6U19_09860 [Bacteroidales bacterium]